VIKINKYKDTEVLVMGANVINMKELQMNKEYQEYYKCGNSDYSSPVVSKPLQKKPVTAQSYTQDYIKLLTNFYN
jgi:hypothetical protein